MTLSRDHLTMIGENTIFFSFNFSLKKYFLHPKYEFFSIKKSAKKYTRLKDLLSSCESINVDKGPGESK